MGRNTRIDWCDDSWNPVTGCLHGCEYCYARRIVHRFSDCKHESGDIHIANYVTKDWKLHFNGEKLETENHKPRIIPYPFGFEPTLHRYKLDIPQHWKKPRTIFVCSMADLFGAWVPDSWIVEVLDACRKAPQHRYLFLTKNPDRYDALEDAGIITPDDKNFWLGSTTTDILKSRLHWDSELHTFQSCEPMLAPWPPAGKPNEKFIGLWPDWVIFGAETGNRKGKVVPEKSWIDNAVEMCRNIGAKVFMKESLRGIMGVDFIQEFPWEVKT